MAKTNSSQFGRVDQTESPEFFIGGGPGGDVLRFTDRFHGKWPETLSSADRLATWRGAETLRSHG
jgi:hypothetical protein